MIEQKPEHIWQAFRKDCLELAIRAGAGEPATAIAAAKLIEDYIMEKSDREKRNAPKGDEEA